MILTPEIVHRIDESGHAWNECWIMTKQLFHSRVAVVISKSDHYMGGYKLHDKLEEVSVSKNGNIEIRADRGGMKWVRARENHVFLQHQIPNTFEYDIFEGRQNKGRWNAMGETLNDLGSALVGWNLERLVIDAYGDKKHALFLVFSDELDAVMFAAAYEQRLKKLGLKAGRK